MKKSHTGELRSIGYFQDNTNRVPYVGGYLDGYVSTVLTVRCKLWKKNMRMVNDTGQVVYHSGYGMQCRFQKAVDANVVNNKSARFIVGNDRYKIESWNIIDSREFWYEFNLSLTNV